MYQVEICEPYALTKRSLNGYGPCRTNLKVYAEGLIALLCSQTGFFRVKNNEIKKSVCNYFPVAPLYVHSMFQTKLHEFSVRKRIVISSGWFWSSVFPLQGPVPMWVRTGRKTLTLTWQKKKSRWPSLKFKLLERLGWSYCWDIYQIKESILFILLLILFSHSWMKTGRTGTDCLFNVNSGPP